MDILKVLATRNNAFGETVVSSIFNYLLDPYADHGFGSAFLIQYLWALSERLEFIDNDLLNALDACQINDDPEVLVTGEWSQESEESGRRIDSIIRIATDKKLYLVATEVKIYERSSSDEEQLNAYADMLSAECENILMSPEEGRHYKRSDIHCVLAYLIPGDSRRGLDFARKSTDYCRDKRKEIHGVIVVPWADSKTIQAYAGLRTTRTMERILFRLLHENCFGKASPANQEALDIVRSLRNVARSNFDYRYLAKNSRSRQFPDNSGYRDGLEDDQRALLECFESAARIELEVKQIAANPLHTSIGIPMSSNPEKGKNNSLCRILTVESYKTRVPQNRFIVQITRRHFERNLKNIEDIVAAFPIKAELFGVGGKEGQLFHENGKKNEPVYRIMFSPDPGEVEGRTNEITLAFGRLIDVLKESYQE